MYEANTYSAVSATSGLSSSTCPRCKANLENLCPNQITADVEVIPIQKVNEAYERLSKSDVKYRFCIDVASSSPNNQPDI